MEDLEELAINITMSRHRHRQAGHGAGWGDLKK